MARRRGFFAEMQHQMAVAERDRQRATAAQVRAQQQQRREWERRAAVARKAELATARANERDRAAAEREEKRLHLEARQAEADSMDADLRLRLEDIDGILKATLSVDDYVDLEALRKQVEHPPFESRFSRPTPRPAAISLPPEPFFNPPPPPSGLFGKKKHAEQTELARQEFHRRHSMWQMEAANVPYRQRAQEQEYQSTEEERLARLRAETAVWERDCRAREEEAARDNSELDELIRDFAAGRTDAVEEYFAIVLRNSVYPEGIELGITYDIDTSVREMKLHLDLPTPETIPAERGFKYVKSRDEISAVAQTQKEQRDRYAGVVHNICLRTMHEIWEADRTKLIDSISLTAGVAHTNPATGRDTETVLVAVAVEREEFLQINLERVAPGETLAHLGATVSKNPLALVGIDLGPGVRGR